MNDQPSPVQDEPDDPGAQRAGESDALRNSEVLVPTAADPGASAASEPDAQGVSSFLLYSLSLPERAIRSTSGVVGAAVKHSAALLVPQAFQDSRTYTVLVRYTLDFMIEDVGGVKPAVDPNAPAAAPPVDQFVARKTVGSFLDLAGMATLHLSPIVVLAVLSDVAYGSRTYLKELSQELKTKGLIDERSTIDGASDLLEAVSQASGVTAGALDSPPLSIDGLKETISQTRDAVTRINVRQVIPQAELERMWSEMHEIADDHGLDLMSVSSAMTLHSLGKVGQLGQGALSSVRVAGNLFDRHILDHYRLSISEIKQRGFYATLAETSAPYIEAVWKNFSSDQETWTQQLVTGKLFGQAARAVGGWIGRTRKPRDVEAESESKLVESAPSDAAADDASAAKVSTPPGDAPSPPSDSSTSAQKDEG